MLHKLLSNRRFLSKNHSYLNPKNNRNGMLVFGVYVLGVLGIANIIYEVYKEEENLDTHAAS
jgi:hypothetical protein